MTTAARKQVLVTGGSIAGPTAAYWLAHTGNGTLFDVTVLERAPAFRSVGQGIDVRGAGVEVMRRMGLEEAIRGQTSHEEGIHVMDQTGRVVGSFPVGEGGGLTSDIEIPRGTLARLIVEKAESVGVKFVYGDCVRNVEEEENDSGTKKQRLKITYAKSEETHVFDLLVIADGLFSQTRDLVFGKDTLKKYIYDVGAYTTWFSIPRDEKIDDRWGRALNIPGRRAMFLRPDNTGTRTLVNLSICTSDPVYDQAMHTDMTTQKELWSSRFKHAGWQAERVIQGMLETSDFYVQKLAQIRMDHWTRGCAALVGDAGYCPTPLTGMGTSCAIVGAYVLAGEVARNPDEIEEALKAYEARLRPFVDTAQKLPPGAPWIINPETAWGIWFLRLVVAFASWTKIYKLFSWGNPPADAIVLPHYDM